MEDDVLDGDATNWAAFPDKMLEIGGHVLRIRPSPTDREENEGVEPCTESDTNERGDDGLHATTARNDRQRSGYIQVEGGTGSVSFSNDRHRTNAARVVGGIQQLR